MMKNSIYSNEDYVLIRAILQKEPVDASGNVSRCVIGSGDIVWVTADDLAAVGSTLSGDALSWVLGDGEPSDHVLIRATVTEIDPSKPTSANIRCVTADSGEVVWVAPSDIAETQLV